MKYRVQIGDQEREVDVRVDDTGEVSVELDGHPVDVEVARVPDGLSLRIDGKIFDIAVGGPSDDRSVAIGPARGVIAIESERERRRKQATGGAAATGDLRAPMPGRVVKVLVAEGDEVDADQPIVVVEAMKMENELRAAGPGTVEKVHVTEGQNVEGNSVLVSIK